LSRSFTVRGALADPNVVVLIDEDAADLTEDPIVRERLGPTSVNFEFRRNVRGKSEPDKREGGHSCKRQCMSKFHQSLLVWPKSKSGRASAGYLQ
jgi:hypothetical protein